MTRRAAILFCASALTALAQSSNFVWDYSGWGPDLRYGGSAYGWVVNGDGTFASTGGGSDMWPTGVSGANPNDYEINTTLLLNSPGGTYMHFLRAATTVVPGSGSYISVELAVPSNWQSGGAVPLAVNQCVNGTVTQLASTSVPLHPGDALRSIVFGTNLWIFINNIQYGTYTIPQTTGQPGYAATAYQAAVVSHFIARRPAR